MFFEISFETGKARAIGSFSHGRCDEGCPTSLSNGWVAFPYVYGQYETLGTLYFNESSGVYMVPHRVLHPMPGVAQYLVKRSRKLYVWTTNSSRLHKEWCWPIKSFVGHGIAYNQYDAGFWSFNKYSTRRPIYYIPWGATRLEECDLGIDVYWMCATPYGIYMRTQECIGQLYHIDLRMRLRAHSVMSGPLTRSTPTYSNQSLLYLTYSEYWAKDSVMRFDIRTQRSEPVDVCDTIEYCRQLEVIDNYRVLVRGDTCAILNTSTWTVEPFTISGFGPEDLHDGCCVGTDLLWTHSDVVEESVYPFLMERCMNLFMCISTEECCLYAIRSFIQ